MPGYTQLDTVSREEEEGIDERVPARPNGGGGGRGRFTQIVAAAAIVLLILLGVGILPRLRRQTELNDAAKEFQSGVYAVTVVKPQAAPPTSEMLLPGTTQAVNETSLFPRANGYVHRWVSDIGDRVKEGQVLAEIETPEIDEELRQGRQQLEQASRQLSQSKEQLGQTRAGLEQNKAALNQAKTNLELARVNLTRSRMLVKQGVVAQQDTDEKQAAFDAQEAMVVSAQAAIKGGEANVSASGANVSSQESNVEGNKANVQRLVALQAFKKITAPFAGVITARNVDIGTLVAPPTSSTATPLFRIARTDTIRTFISVPQTFVESIKAGQVADVLVKELPQKRFLGTVVRTSSALDTAAHTLLTEIHVDNKDNSLLPGMYAQVKLTLTQQNHPFLIPAAAIVVRTDGTYVTIVKADQTVHYQKIEIGRDFGAQAEIISGLAGDESLVTNPTDSLHEGAKVKVVGQ